jgi:integrase
MTSHTRVNDGKTDVSERALALSDWLVDMLRERRVRLAEKFNVDVEELIGPVFPNSLDTLRGKHNTLARWREFRERAGYPWVTIQTFRRSVATLLDDAGLTAAADRGPTRPLEGVDDAGHLHGTARDQQEGRQRAGVD